MDKKVLKEIVLEQKDTLIELDLGVEREALETFQEKIKLPHVLVIAGIRRAGKSFLLAQIARKFFSPDDYYYINFEDERFIDFSAGDFNSLYEVLLELLGERKVFFLDEIQNIKGWERFVRRFQENNFKFIVTGSNASLLSRELGTRLSGRHLSTELYPFSFLEYLRFNKINPSESAAFKTKERAKINKLFSGYLREGGMPEYLKYKNKDILRGVYNDILYRDIMVRFKLDEEKMLRELALYLLSNIGNLYTYNKLKKFLGFGSANTVRKYISYFENSFLMASTELFSYSFKKKNVSPKKIYAVDSGLVNALAIKFSRDEGALLENAVFNELQRRGSQVYYYKTSQDREIDFVIAENRKINQLIQVCSNLQNKETYLRETEGLFEAMKELKTEKGMILTKDGEEKIIKKGGQQAEIKNVWKWMLEM